MPSPSQSQPRHWVRAVANVVNLSTPLGLLVALFGGSRLRRGPNLIWYAERYGLGFPIAGAFTMGNVVLIPRRTAAELEASRPGVMAHEDIHAWQWAYCLGLPFLPIYVAAQGWSWLRTGHIGSANFFEVQAGLATGGYPDLPKRPLRAGFAALRRVCARMIRPATPLDCPAMLDVMFSTAMSRESSWWTNTVETLTAKLAEGGGFVWETGGEIVGCVMHVTDGDTLTLRGLAVRPEFGGRRIGTALVAAVEAEARRLGCARVLLAVSQSNLEVCDYYLRLGYSVIDEPYAQARPGRPAPVVFDKRL